MAKEAKIDPGSQTGPSFCFAGFGTDRLRCEQAMKTAERENPNRRPQCVANRADGAASQYRSCSIMWAAKQENFQPAEKCFFLTSPFIELTGQMLRTLAGVAIGSIVTKLRFFAMEKSLMLSI